MLGKIEGKISGRERIRWLDSITDSVDINLSKLQETVKDSGAWHAMVHGVEKSQASLSNWTATVKIFIIKRKNMDMIPFLMTHKHKIKK